MSIRLEADDVDDGYFTPVASTTLASIFKEDSSNDAAVNPSLKYKPPQLKKSEETIKPEDVFSCSIIAYEWVQGTHKCKGKVGFAMMKNIRKGLCKIILYGPDKSTISCTTITPLLLLEVTMSSGTMISFYDDHKKYWGLCFSDKNIEKVMELLKLENVAIKPYISPEFKPEMLVDSDEAADETGNSSTTEDDCASSAALENNKISILSRIANVGHAILPSKPGSPVKKTTSLDVTSKTDLCGSTDKLNVLPNLSTRKGTDNTTLQDLTKHTAVETGHKNAETNNILTNCQIGQGQTSVTSLPLVNNQIFTYVNGYMVPLHIQVPVLDNVNGPDTCAEIELIIHKLTHLKSVVKTMETKQLYNIELSQSDQVLKKISDLEQSIREKDETIKHFENIRRDLCDRLNDLNEQVHKTTQDLENNKTVMAKEENMLLNRKVKTLMNNTFHSLASNFDDEVNYTGNYVKGILAAIIKKITIESLANLFPNGASISAKGDN